MNSELAFRRKLYFDRFDKSLQPDLTHLTASEAEARTYFERFLAGEAPACPKCGTPQTRKRGDGRYHCRCGYTFQPFRGRWIDAVHLSFREWAILIATFAVGATDNEIARKLGRSYASVRKATLALRLSLLAAAFPDDSRVYTTRRRNQDIISSAERQLLTGYASSMRGLLPSLVAQFPTQHMPQEEQGRVQVFGMQFDEERTVADWLPDCDYRNLLRGRLPMQAVRNVVITEAGEFFDAFLFVCPQVILREQPARFSQILDPSIDRKRWQKYIATRIRQYRSISPLWFPLFIRQFEFELDTPPKARFGILAQSLCQIRTTE